MVITSMSNAGSRDLLSLNGTFHWDMVPYDFPTIVLRTKLIVSFHL